MNEYSNMRYLPEPQQFHRVRLELTPQSHLSTINIEMILFAFSDVPLLLLHFTAFANFAIIDLLRSVLANSWIISENKMTREVEVSSICYSILLQVKIRV